MVQNFLGLSAKLRGGKFLAAHRTIQRDCLLLHFNRGLRRLPAANVANKVAHVDDEKLFAGVDERANLLSTAGRGGQPRPANFGRHRAVRELDAYIANRIPAAADDARGIRRGAVEFVGRVHVSARRHGNCHIGLHVLVLVRIFGARNFFRAQGRTKINRLEF